MKSTKRSDARLLVLFGILALLPLAIWACTDAGDAPSPATGPSTVYNPAMDQNGATVTAVASNSTVAAGGTIGITATYRDANGLPVEGAPLGVWPEAGFGSAPYFMYYTNPTLTDANGMVSIHVYVMPVCPPDSYTFAVGTHPGLNGPFARGLVHVRVTGTGVPGLTITDPTIAGMASLNTGVTGTYTAQGAVCSDGDVEEYQFTATNGPTEPSPTSWGSATATFTWAGDGIKTVSVRARCRNTPSLVSGEASMQVTVSAPAGP